MKFVYETHFIYCSYVIYTYMNKIFLCILILLKTKSSIKKIHNGFRWTNINYFI